MIALVVVGVLGGAVFGARSAVSATGTPAPVARALAPVGVDGSLSSDPAPVPVGVTAPVSAPLPAAGRGPARGATGVGGTVTDGVATEWVRAIAGNSFFPVCRTE